MFTTKKPGEEIKKTIHFKILRIPYFSKRDWKNRPNRYHHLLGVSSFAHPPRGNRRFRKLFSDYLSRIKITVGKP